MFPKTVVGLYEAFVEVESGAFNQNGAPIAPESVKDVILEGRTETMQILRDLQRAIAAGEELIVKWGTVGVKEGVSRVLGFGDSKVTRLPLKGGLPDGAWGEFQEAFEELGGIEKGL